jgi:hypothetical protein
MWVRRGGRNNFRLNALCGVNGGGSVHEPPVRLGSHSNNLCGVHKDFFLMHDGQICMG